MKIKLTPLVLMYHGIVADPALTLQNREIGAELYDVPLANFKAQMNHLKQLNYQATLLNETQNSDKKPFILTFDDGELNNFQEAWPVLKALDWKAYFFVIVDRIGTRGYLGWEELKEMCKSGMVIGSHGLSHEILTQLPDEQLEEELYTSKKNLEITLGISIDSISIPRGFCNDHVIRKAYEAGYKYVFISSKPGNMKSECITRIAIKSDWSLKRFNQLLTGKTPLKEHLDNFLKNTLKIILSDSGYNWIRKTIIKSLK